MVKCQTPSLDRTFAALSDPTRRALLEQLGARQTMSVSELARPFSISLPAVMKHLDVLSDAGLISRTKTGRVVACEFRGSAHGRRHELAQPLSSNSGPNNSIVSPLSWRKSHARPSQPRRQAKPHPQTSSQCGARKSLRRVDGARKALEVVWARRGPGQAGSSSMCAAAAATPSCSTPRTAKSTTSAASTAR